MNKPDLSQEETIHEVFRTHGYGVEIPLRNFPMWCAHEFNRAIHNLRHRNGLNIGNRTASRVTAEGRRVTDSFYTLYPGRWSDLRGKPETGYSTTTRQQKVQWFTQTYNYKPKTETAPEPEPAEWKLKP